MIKFDQCLLELNKILICNLNVYYLRLLHQSAYVGVNFSFSKGINLRVACCNKTAFGTRVHVETRLLFVLETWRSADLQKLM